MSDREVKIGFPVFSVLGIVFITLKLVGVIAWSWWWVLAPFWMPLAFAMIILLTVGVLVGSRSDK